MGDNRKKQTYLLLNQKLEIVAKLDKGATLRDSAKKYNVGKTTICRIKSSKKELMKATKLQNPNVMNSRFLPRSTHHHRALYKWYLKEKASSILL